jgi:hypothetical protein
VRSIVNVKESSLGFARAELRSGESKGVSAKAPGKRANGKEVSSTMGRMLPPRDCATLCALLGGTVGKGDGHQTGLHRIMRRVLSCEREVMDQECIR